MKLYDGTSQRSETTEDIVVVAEQVWPELIGESSHLMVSRSELVLENTQTAAIEEKPADIDLTEAFDASNRISTGCENIDTDQNSRNHDNNCHCENTANDDKLLRALNGYLKPVVETKNEVLASEDALNSRCEQSGDQSVSANGVEMTDNMALGQLKNAGGASFSQNSMSSPDMVMKFTLDMANKADPKSNGEELDATAANRRRTTRCPCSLWCCCRAGSKETGSDWLILLAVASFNLFNGLTITGFTVLYIDLVAYFESTKAAVGWVPSIKNSIACVLGIFMSEPINRFGCRVTASIGALVMSVGLSASSLSPSLVWMYLLYGVIGGLGMSVSTLAQCVIVQQRFSSNRTLATGISTIGFTVGHFLGAPVMNWLLSTYGLRGALLLIGAIIAHRVPLALTFYTPAKFMQKKKVHVATVSDVTLPADAEPRDVIARDTPTCRTRFISYLSRSLNFKLLYQPMLALFCAAGFLHRFMMNSYMSHMTGYGLNAGLSRNQAVWTVSVISITAFTGRLMVTLIGDRKFINRLLLFAFGMFFAFVSILVIIVVPGLTGFVLSAILFGLNQATTNTLLGVVLVDLMGVKQIARSLAIFNFCCSFAFLMGAPSIGWLYDRQRSYTVGYSLLAGFALIGSIFVFIVFILHRRLQRRLAKTAGTTPPSPS